MSRIKGKRQVKEWPCQKCGWCCEAFLMDTQLINSHRHQFQRPVKKETTPQRFFGKFTIIFTEDNNCVFLRFDNTCAIYEDRPLICKIFGLSGGEHECPNVAPNGRIRSKDEAKRAKIRISLNNAKGHKDLFDETGISTRGLYENE